MNIKVRGPSWSALQLASKLNGYVAALAVLAATVGLQYGFRAAFGKGFVGVFFVYMLAFLIAAWCGYGPGLLVVGLAVGVVPYLFDPKFTIRNLNLGGLAVLVIISLLVSRVSASRSKTEESLRRSNEDLDDRVRRRTAEVDQANTALQNQFAELEELYGKLPVGVCFFDTSLRYVRINERLAEINGVPAAAHVGRLLRETVPPAVAEIVEPLFRRVMETGEPFFDHELRSPVPTAPEKEGFWLVGCSPVNAKDGTRLGIQVIVQDLAARKQAEAGLSLMASIIESSEDAVISKNLDGIISSWNPAAERIYGYSAEKAIGRSMAMLLPPDRATEEEQLLRRLRQGHRVDHFETTRVREDGKIVHVSLTISPIRDASGRVIGASHIARDISERRLFEEQLRQTQKLESLGILAGGVAHDFNNLLTGILGNASLALETTPVANANHALLEEVVRAAQRAADLTRQLLAYAGKGRFITSLVDISELVREVTSLVHTSVPKNVQLRLELASNLPPVEADTGQIQQIVMNLVINAAEAIVGETGRWGSDGQQWIDEQYIAMLAASGVSLRPGQYVCAAGTGQWNRHG